MKVFVINSFYRPPTKFREGNVFSRVYSLGGGGGSHVIITHDALDLTVKTSRAPATSLAGHGTSLDRDLPASAPSPTGRGTSLDRHPTGMVLVNSASQLDTAQTKPCDRLIVLI